MDIYGAHTAERVCFHILVQQFIGIQFWTVGSRLRAYEGKRVRISDALESPHVIVVRTIDEVD